MLDTSDQGLTERDLTDQRNDAKREGVKALVLMNGGGAVALLAFLQAIWHKDHVLAFWIVFGLAFLVVGVGSAGLVHLFRVHTSNATQEVFHVLGLDHETRETSICDGPNNEVSASVLRLCLHLAVLFSCGSWSRSVRRGCVSCSIPATISRALIHSRRTPP